MCEAFYVKQIKSMKKVRVAITGGIGSGKSAVAEYIASLGYLVYSCDAIYKNIFQRKEFQNKLLKEFPNCEIDGRVDKKRLASHIFSDETARERLNQLSHKEVFVELEKLISSSRQDVVFVEVPLLFEGGYENQFDYVLVVVRSLHQRIKSVVERDGLSQEEVLQRISAQWDYENNLSDLKGNKYFIFENNETISRLHEKITAILKSINETIIVKQ